MNNMSIFEGSKDKPTFWKMIFQTKANTYTQAIKKLGMNLEKVKKRKLKLAIHIDESPIYESLTFRYKNKKYMIVNSEDKEYGT